MQTCHLESIPWKSWTSPSGRFGGSGRPISIALGARPNAPINEGGHPFDVELGRLMPGKAVCPFHSHWTQWEL
ncbi:MAG: cupin, partial [Verrucomicrobia bacterium]